MGQFPLLTLQDILFSKSFQDKKIQIYIHQCNKHNILWIEGIVSEIHRILSSHKMDIKPKIHSLILLKQIIKTCQYSVLFLIQSYLLSFIVNISQYHAKHPQLQQNSKFFQSLGYSPTYPNIQQLSHNYVIMASQILFMCSHIRPKQNYLKQELKKDSPFYKAFLKIKDKNYKIFKDAQLQKKLSITQLRCKYKQQLSDFQNHSYFYIDHYMKKLQQYIFSTQENKINQNLDFKILLKKGDVYLTSQSIARLTEMIDFIDQFKIKSKALALLNELILWGDIQAVITVNYTQYFQKIFREFFKIDGSKGLKKGQQIFAQINGQYEQKRKFYTDFLRCLQIWAQVFPHEHTIFYDKQQNQTGYSPIYKNYRFIKQVRKFTFPENIFLDKIKTQIRQNLKNNQERNLKIINDLNNEMNELSIQYKISFEQIRKNTQRAYQYLQKLKQKNKQQDIELMMLFLIKYEENFQLELQTITESVQSNILDDIIQKGLICIQIINRIQPEFQKLKRNKINIKQFHSFCIQNINFSKINKNDLSINASRSIIDRKSQIKTSILSKYNKSNTSLRGLTEQTRMRIIKKKYLQRLQKIANRTSSQKDDSFLNTSFLNTKRTNQSFKILPIQSNKRLPQNINNTLSKQSNKLSKIKSLQKYGQTNILKSPRQNHMNGLKSPRQTGKKVFLVSKYLQKNEQKNIQNVKNQIIKQNWNSNKKILLTQKNEMKTQIVQRQKGNYPSLLQKNQFSFVDQINGTNSINNKQSKLLSNKSVQPVISKQNVLQVQTKSNIIGHDYIKIIDQVSQSKGIQSDMFQSPKFGNTEIKMENSQNSNESRKRFRKGVGLAKQFVNLTDKLIGPKNQLVKFEDYKIYFPYTLDSQNKRDFISKQITIIDNDLIKIDRVSVVENVEQKLNITLYIFPKKQCERIRVKIIETPSIYINVKQNKNIKIQKGYYEYKNVKYGEQYQFQIIGSIVKTPIIMPHLEFKINQSSIKQSNIQTKTQKVNQIQTNKYVLPFPLLHIIKFKKPQPKYLSKQFQLANKVISQQFELNKQILSSLSDLDDYISQLTEIKSDKPVKRYRTQGYLNKTSFIVQFKSVQNNITIQACLLNIQSCDKSIIQFFIAQCMNMFGKI